MRTADAARLSELIADPRLLDLRQTVALSQALIEGLRLPPIPEATLAAAEGGDPDAIASLVAANEIRGKIHESVIKHGRLQGQGTKAEIFAQVVVQGVLPLLAAFVTRAAEASRRYVPAGSQAAYRRDLERILSDAHAEFAALLDGA